MNKDKTIFTSAALVLGFSCLYYLMNRAETETTSKMTHRELQKQLEADLFILGRIAVDEEGLLPFEDWDRIFRIVNKHVLLQSEVLLAQDCRARVELLKSHHRGTLPIKDSWRSRWYTDKYREIALNSFNRQAELEQQLLHQVCEKLGFTTQTYFASAEFLIATDDFEIGKN